MSRKVLLLSEGVLRDPATGEFYLSMVEPAFLWTAKSRGRLLRW
jgi:hypothetical protein